MEEKFSGWDDDDNESSIAPLNLNPEDVFIHLPLSGPLVHLCASGFEKRNESKNRYSDVIPTDETRVILDKSISHSDYINANFVILDEKYSWKTIATQGPLEKTETDFWAMIFQYKVPFILMATSLREKDREKSTKYWPGPGEKFKRGDFDLEATNVEYVSPLIGLTEIKMSTMSKETHTLIHLYYTGCADYSTPEHTSLRDVLLLLNIIWEDRTKPFVCHCSAGIGRTGIIISILNYFFAESHEENWHAKTSQEILQKVRDIVWKIRTQRCGLVQSVEQFKFIINFIEEEQLFFRGKLF